MDMGGPKTMMVLSRGLVEGGGGLRTDERGKVSSCERREEGQRV